MPSRSNYVCVKCEKEMRLERSGVLVEEHMDDGSPYKIWAADLWECEKCHHQCLLGFGDSPIAHHYDLDYYVEKQKKVEFHIK